jgi:hypothetical protein
VYSNAEGMTVNSAWPSHEEIINVFARAYTVYVYVCVPYVQVNMYTAQGYIHVCLCEEAGVNRQPLACQSRYRKAVS